MLNDCLLSKKKLKNMHNLLKDGKKNKQEHWETLN